MLWQHKLHMHDALRDAAVVVYRTWGMRKSLPNINVLWEDGIGEIGHDQGGRKLVSFAVWVCG